MDVTNDIITQVIEYIFTDNRGMSDGKSEFDHQLDFRYVYPSFIQLYNYDLLKENPAWWKYSYMLEGCFMMETPLSSAMRNRNLDVTKIKDQKAKENALSLKNRYRLRNDKPADISGLFKALKGVAKRG